MHTLYGPLAMVCNQLDSIVETRIKKYGTLVSPRKMFRLLDSTVINLWTNDERIAQMYYEPAKEAGLNIICSEDPNSAMGMAVLIAVFVVPKEISERQKNNITHMECRIQSRFHNFVDDFAALVVVKDMEK